MSFKDPIIQNASDIIMLLLYAYANSFCTTLRKKITIIISDGNFSSSFIIWMHYVGYCIKSFVVVSAVGFPDILHYIMHPLSNK